MRIFCLYVQNNRYSLKTILECFKDIKIYLNGLSTVQLSVKPDLNNGSKVMYNLVMYVYDVLGIDSSLQLGRVMALLTRLKI